MFYIPIKYPLPRPSPKGEGDLFPLGGNKKGGKEVERILVIGNEYLIILKEKEAMANKNYLVNGQTIIDKPAFPAIDAHNHLWGNWQVERVIKTLDEVGVVSYCDLTGNVHIEFSGGGYVIQPGNISDFFENCSFKYPGRFYCFTMANFATPVQKPLFTDHKRFVSECIETMNEHHSQGAKGLKYLRSLDFITVIPPAILFSVMTIAFSQYGKKPDD